MLYEIKNVSGEITDVDEKSNMVSGYASVFSNKDADGDVIQPGAFTKSLGDGSKRQLHLYQHDPMRPLSSVKGGSLKLMEDPKGLKFESTISKTSWGADVIKLIQDGVLNENSIGFQTIKAMDRKDYRELQELKLYEVSSVSWASNPMALNDTKSFYTDDFLGAKIETVTKAFRKGTYTDETFNQLEIYLYQLNQILIETKSTSPVVQTAAKPVIEDKAIQRVKALNTLIKSAPHAPVISHEVQEMVRKRNARAGLLFRPFLLQPH